MRFLKSLFIIASLLAISAQPLAAQTYPNRPVRLIVPFPPGQSTDTLARFIADGLARRLGQPFVVDNKAGAGGIIGTEAAAKAAPDGYTLVMATSGPFGVNPAVYPKLPYDPLRDFAPIINIANNPQVLFEALPGRFADLQTFVSAAKEKPGSIDYATLGTGSTSHLTTEAFQAAAGIRLNHIPFKGSSEAQAQVLGANIPVMFDALPSVLAQIKAGKVHALAVSSRERSAFAPNIPTVAEQGFPGFEVIGTLGLAAPAGTPPEVLDRVNAEVNSMLAQADFQQRLASFAFKPAGGSRQEFAAFMKAEVAKWTAVARRADIKVE